jgi:hypothetical protein
MCDGELLNHLRAELLERGYMRASILDVDELATALQMLGMDEAQPWHEVRVHFAGGASSEARAIADGIRGFDRENALANARWNWPSASRVEYVGLTGVEAAFLPAQERSAPRAAG